MYNEYFSYIKNKEYNKLLFKNIFIANQIIIKKKIIIKFIIYNNKSFNYQFNLSHNSIKIIIK